MAYSDFTLEKLEQSFGIKSRRHELFVKPLKKLKPSAKLENDLEEAKQFPLTSEKAKSEFIITPILKEIYRNSEASFTLFSGVPLDVDKKKGLKGICDYLLCREAFAMYVKAPIFCLVESKYRAIEEGFGQCAAEMYAAQIYNKQEWLEDLPFIFGAVTNGNDWVFMKFQNMEIMIHNEIFTLQNLPELLGAFQNIIDLYP